MANTKIDRIKLNGNDTVYDIDLPTDATPTITSLTVSGIKNASVVGTDANGKLTASQIDLTNYLLKNNASGTGSFTWTGPDQSPLDVTFNVKDTQAAEIMGYDPEYAAMSLSATPYGPVTLELFTHDTSADLAIKFNREGEMATIGLGGITIGSDKKVSWPSFGGKLLTSGDLATTTTDPTTNQGKIPTLGDNGKLAVSLSTPWVSQYASESALPGSIHFDPSYVPDALYVTTDTNSIYRYNKDTETYIKLGPDTSTYLDKGTSSTTVTQTIYNPVEMKKALTVPSVQGTKYTDNSGAQQSLFILGGTVSETGGSSQGSSSLTLYRNRAGSWDSTSITFTPTDGLKIDKYAVGVQSWASVPSSYILTNGDGVTKDMNGGVHLTTTGGTSDDFFFNSFKNGKLHSKITFGDTGPVGGGWCIDNSKILTEANFSFDSSTGTLTIN